MRRSLARKLGPLPVWGWLAIGGAVLLYVRQRNTQAQDAQAATQASGSMYGGGGYQGDPYAAPGAGPQAAAQSGTDASGAGRESSATGNVVNVNLAAQPTQGVTQPPLTAPRATPRASLIADSSLLAGPVHAVGSGVNPDAGLFAAPLPRTVTGTVPTMSALPSAVSSRYLSPTR